MIISGEFLRLPAETKEVSPETRETMEKLIERLEEAIIRTIARWNIKGERIEGASGVWIDQNRKICAVGVRSSRYVTMHGFALNANTDLKWFGLINPCGFTDRGVTSIARETGREVDMEELKSIFKKMFMKNFDIKIKQEDYANREKLGNQATGRREQSG